MEETFEFYSPHHQNQLRALQVLFNQHQHLLPGDMFSTLAQIIVGQAQIIDVTPYITQNRQRQYTLDLVDLEEFFQSPQIMLVHQPTFVHYFTLECSEPLVDVEQVISLDLSGLHRLRALELTLSVFPNLQHFRISQLTYFEDFNPEVFEDCDELLSIEATDLPRLEQLPDSLIMMLPMLRLIDLRDNLSLKDLGEDFANECPELKEIKLQGCLNLYSINNIAIECPLLEEFDFSAIPKIGEVGEAAFSDSGLRTFDLRPLQRVYTLNIGVVQECPNLDSIHLDHLTTLSSIFSYFAFNCTNLVTISLQGLVNLTYIGDYFLSNCIHLRQVDLSDAVNLRVLGKYFMSGCIRLEMLNLSNLAQVTYYDLETPITDTIPGFLKDCLNLQQIITNELTSAPLQRVLAQINLNSHRALS